MTNSHLYSGVTYPHVGLCVCRLLALVGHKATILRMYSKHVKCLGSTVHVCRTKYVAYFQVWCEYSWPALWRRFWHTAKLWAPKLDHQHQYSWSHTELMFAYMYLVWSVLIISINNLQKAACPADQVSPQTRQHSEPSTQANPAVRAVCLCNPQLNFSLWILYCHPAMMEPPPPQVKGAVRDTMLHWTLWDFIFRSTTKLN